MRGVVFSYFLNKHTQHPSNKENSHFLFLVSFLLLGGVHTHVIYITRIYFFLYIIISLYILFTYPLRSGVYI